MLFSTLKRSNSRIALNAAIQCSLPTSATSRDGSLLKRLLFPLWTTFLTQTSLVFSRRRPQTRPGCLRSLIFVGVHVGGRARTMDWQQRFIFFSSPRLAFRASRKMPRLPRLAHKVPVMQASMPVISLTFIR